MSTPIRIRDDTREFLDHIGKTSDTYDTAIKKLITHFKISGGIVQ